MELIGSRPGAGQRELPDVNAAIGTLWARFRGIAFDRLETIEAAVRARQAGSLDEDLRRRAEREAHKLAGSVGTFGFAEASRISREIEGLLQGALDAAATELLAGLSASLRTELEGPGEGAAHRSVSNGARAGARTLDARPSVLVIDADAGIAAGVVAEAEARRLRGRVAHDPAAVRAALDEELPDVVVLHLQAAGATERGLELLDEVVRRAPTALPIVTSERDAGGDRLEAERRGARAFLARPCAAPRVLETIQSLLGAEGPPRRVLVVDPDPATLSLAGDVLRAARLDVITLVAGERFWETLERTRPEAVLLADRIGALSGVELCAMLRSDPRWSAMTVLLLLSEPQVAAVAQALAAGADDCVGKPFAGPELQARVTSRMEHRRLRRVAADVDPVTQVANRRAAFTTLTRLAADAARQNQTLALAVVDVDGLREINAQFGEEAGDAVLKGVARVLTETFERECLVGRWNGDAFLVALAGRTRDEAMGTVRRALGHVAATPIETGTGMVISASFSAGVAALPADGDDAVALALAAEEAAAAVSRDGRGKIHAVGGSAQAEARTESVDIVLVEDDIALAGLLGHTLESRGHSTRTIANGAQAIDALCGPAPQFHARVIILDVDLPGRDGFDVLRALAEAGVTERSRVVMLTVRATEAEVVRALELGAFDHVAKPFSVQILMQRLRRALGE